jgi:hypothetical protein
MQMEKSWECGVYVALLFLSLTSNVANSLFAYRTSPRTASTKNPRKKTMKKSPLRRNPTTRASRKRR